MVRSPGHNSARRNRRIGTKMQGYRPRQGYHIPDVGLGRRFYEKLDKPVELSFDLGGHSFVLLVEPPLAGFRYHVSIPDILEVLKLIPEDDRRDFAIICLRQPKRKHMIFSHVWGRMVYWADIGRYSGPAVVIEASPLNYSYRVGTSIRPGFAREIAALEKDGHRITRDGSRLRITCPPEAIRATQLFRTLPHEIGHYVDFRRKVLVPADEDGADYDLLHSLYFARPQSEREAFADRYAAEIMAPFRDNAIVPFPPLSNRDEDIPAEWFHVAPSSDLQS